MTAYSGIFYSGTSYVVIFSMFEKNCETACSGIFYSGTSYVVIFSKFENIFGLSRETACSGIFYSGTTYVVIFSKFENILGLSRKNGRLVGGHLSVRWTDNILEAFATL